MHSHHQHGRDDGRVRQIVHRLKQTSPEEAGESDGSAAQTAESAPSGLTTRRAGSQEGPSSGRVLAPSSHSNQHPSTSSARRRIRSPAAFHSIRAPSSLARSCTVNSIPLKQATRPRPLLAAARCALSSLPDTPNSTETRRVRLCVCLGCCFAL